MKTPVVYGVKTIFIENQPYVVVGSKEMLPNERFNELCDVLKGFGGRYVPETRKWIVPQQGFSDLLRWSESDETWAQQFLIDAQAYDALIEATRD